MPRHFLSGFITNMEYGGELITNSEMRANYGKKEILFPLIIGISKNCFWPWAALINKGLRIALEKITE